MAQTVVHAHSMNLFTLEDYPALKHLLKSCLNNEVLALILRTGGKSMATGRRLREKSIECLCWIICVPIPD